MTIHRRGFLAGLAPAFLRGAALTPRQRIDRVLHGETSDRTPISLWHHFGLEKQGPAAHARRTLEFHRTAQTDLVKVMSDFPYPKPAGNWWELKPLDSPFAPQLQALGLIREGLQGNAHFVETVFNPWNVAEKLSSRDEVLRMMRERPQVLLDALGAIARSEANHAARALATGASGIFLAIANAQKGIMTPEEYRKFSEPFDRMVLQAASGAALNVLHLHGDKVHLELFQQGWGGAAINYSAAETGVSLQAMRAKFAGVLLGGIDHRNFKTRTVEQLKADAAAARKQAGNYCMLCPGCSVPDDSTAAEVAKLRLAV
jgi:uroporphyrinogen decarboxylase